MRGHTFVWHNQVPAWVFQDAGGVDMSTEPFSQANKQLLLSRLQNHINALINHYQGNIYVWDVVNEAIDESQSDGFRRTKWYTITQDPSLPPGTPPEFMDDAFIYARQALDNLGFDRTQVKLCYNDFNTTIPAKRQFIFNWVQGAITRGVPIDCVGNQFHNTINFPIDDLGSANSKQNVIATLNQFASLTSTAGVPIINEVTEFDVSMYRFGNCSQTFYSDYDDLTAGDTVDLINEGYRYRDYFQIFKSLKNEIDSVTIWGLGDDDSWLNPHSNAAGCPGVTVADAPLPFDSGLQHKFAYTGIVNPLALPGANLVTTVAASPGTVGSGKLETLVATVDNQGPNDAANLTFTEQVPSTTLLRSFVAPTGWSCTVPAFMTSGTVSCTASSLVNGASAQFTLTVKTSCPIGKLTDTATVTSTTLNPNPTPQNSGSVNFVVVNPGTTTPQVCTD
jgi:endo-1,4-beta-xylanase